MHRRVPLSEDTVDTTAEDAPAGLRLAARRDLCNVRVQPDQPFPTVPAADSDAHAKARRDGAIPSILRAWTFVIPSSLSVSSFVIARPLWFARNVSC